MIVKRKKKDGTAYMVRVEGFPAKTFDKWNKATEYERRLKSELARTEWDITCGELVDRWLGFYEAGTLPRQNGKAPKPSTLTHRKQDLKRFKTKLGDLPVRDLPSSTEAEEWGMKNRWALVSVSPVINYAVSRRMCDENPFAEMVPKPGRGRRDHEPLTDKEVGKLIELAHALHPTLGAFVTWQAYEGTRPGEAYALDWPLEWASDDEIWIRKSKTGERTIYLFDEAKEALESIKADLTGPVFKTVRGKRFTTQNMHASYWTKLEEDFGREVDPYELRHYCAHRLYVRNNIPATVVARQLGNSPALIESTYGHWKSSPFDAIRTAFLQEPHIPRTTEEEIAC